ncbi:MAG: hypothetical protein CM1200mP27_08350 [Chloroflexota bacterium]|nr:MAG: hypothetical protein CM1200mP27_08350 [Chloroflexota bacterium]
MLIAPDNVPAHPYAVAMEVANLAPNSETTIFPWKDSQEHIDEVVNHARRFLNSTNRSGSDSSKGHAPAAGTSGYLV